MKIGSCNVALLAFTLLVSSMLMAQGSEGDHRVLPTQNHELSPEDKQAKLEGLVEAAATGDADAEAELGDEYFSGELGPANYTEGLRLLLRAADKGSDDALERLADVYILGLGVDPDYEKGFSYFNQLLEDGNRKAPRFLGTHYELGIGTEINYRKAAEFYQAAARKGDITGTCALGAMYERGLGVEQSYERAAELYLESTERGDIIASPGWAAMGNLFETRTDGKKDIDAAIGWYQKAANIGNPDGYAGLIRLGHRGPKPNSPGQNYCLTVLMLVSELNTAPVYRDAAHKAWMAEKSLQMAGKARESGNNEEELSYIQAAADTDFPPAVLELGKAYEEGRIVRRDRAKGQELIRAAAARM